MLDNLKTYATQPSTWKGLLRLLASVGVFSLSPEATDAAVQNILLIVGGLFAANGLIDIIRDEKRP